jgi:hypothetical protein
VTHRKRRRPRGPVPGVPPKGLQPEISGSSIPGDLFQDPIVLILEKSTALLQALLQIPGGIRFYIRISLGPFYFTLVRRVREYLDPVFIFHRDATCTDLASERP